MESKHDSVGRAFVSGQSGNFLGSIALFTDSLGGDIRSRLIRTKAPEGVIEDAVAARRIPRLKTATVVWNASLEFV